ncbi:UDP-N-acetylglucosamine 2-epimerase (hydrolyzing) [bacterium]|nr:UDP-N-acetylglucosamine 2-epimerase (hydrolyzing) [bacterium]MBU1754069.1 UDP-N-acetylglucosamine 2-epimerase (hydrolyzing) [bacterium]
MKKIMAITGTRAEYGIWRPVFKAIESHHSLSLSLIVTGSHLSPAFGMTIDEIERDGFEVAEKIDIIPVGTNPCGCLRDDSSKGAAISIGKCIIGMADVIQRIQPDIILVLGDRGEMLSGAIAGTYMNVPITHLHGGEVSGSIDEGIRHAITKLSHIHFPATKESARRIIKMGEERKRVFIVGAPGLDSILNEPLIPIEDIRRQFGLKDNFLLLIQHPVVTEVDAVERQITATMEAIVSMGIQTIVWYPNTDPGSQTIVRIINKFDNPPMIRIVKSLPHKTYLSLMKYASVLVGNSSSGIIEAASFHLPVVNIGTRQQSRQRTVNVIDVDHDTGKIVEAIRFALYDKEFKANVKVCKNPYGDGKTSKRIVEILSRIEINNDLLQKMMTY